MLPPIFPCFIGTVKSLIFASEYPQSGVRSRKEVTDRSPVIFKPLQNVLPREGEWWRAAALLDCICCTTELVFWLVRWDSACGKRCLLSLIGASGLFLWGKLSPFWVHESAPEELSSHWRCREGWCWDDVQDSYAAYPGLVSACLLNESTAS